MPQAQGGVWRARGSSNLSPEEYGPVVLVQSPHAGASPDSTPDPAQALAQAGVKVGERLAIDELDDLHPRGPEWRSRGFRAVVAAGGDGTIGTVATQIAGSGLPLGILPLGTSNDTARALGVPLDLAAASAAIAQGIPTPIEIGTARLAGETSASGRCFLHVLTLGLNVAFARLATDVAQRQRWGQLTYAASAVAALAHAQPVSLTMHLSGLEGAQEQETTVSCQALQLAVVNLPLFGGALRLRLPNSHAGLPMLDIVVIEALEAPQLRGLVDGLLSAAGRLAERVRGAPASQAQSSPLPESDEALGLALPGLRRYSARSVTIATPQPVAVTLDGEVRAQTPLCVEVAPEPLPVLLTAAARAALGREEAKK